MRLNLLFIASDETFPQRIRRKHICFSKISFKIIWKENKVNCFNFFPFRRQFGWSSKRILKVISLKTVKIGQPMRMKADIQSILPKSPNKAGNACLKAPRKTQLPKHSHSLCGAVDVRPLTLCACQWALCLIASYLKPPGESFFQ